jgi:hypothetical protein
VTVIPDGALTVSSDGRRASLELSSVAVIDQPRWPARDAEFTPAGLSFRIEWEATDERIAWNDRSKMFRVTGWNAVTRLRASVEVPSTGFRWASDPLDASRASFGVIGDEVNGRYYTAG